MPAMNRVFLMGNLTQDPAVAQVGNGASKASLRLAINETHRGRDGQTKESTCFVDIVAWDKQAQACGQYLNKGALVGVEGRLQFDSWTSQDGQKHNRLLVRADRVHFLGGRRDAAAAGAPGDDEAPEADLEPAAAAAPASPARAPVPARAPARPRAA
jgi:single-strand DNA-binding protein